MRLSRILLGALTAAVIALSTACTSGPTTDLDAAGVTKALAAAGLPATLSVTFDESSDPNKLLGRPGGYTSKTAFTDARVKAPGAKKGDLTLGGSVEVFASADEAEKRAEYIKAIAASGPMFAEYTYVRGPVVLRVSKELTPKDAAAYEAALGDIVE